jgi:hypothetical protein
MICRIPEASPLILVYGAARVGLTEAEMMELRLF